MNPMPKTFYERDVWRKLRYRILRRYGYTCMACKRSRNENVPMHVDHILPISIYPELALMEDNLQILCEDCNLGKSNHYADDLRPKLYVNPKPEETPNRSPLVARAHEIKMKLMALEGKGESPEHISLLREYLDIQKLIASGQIDLPSKTERKSQ